MTRTPRILAKQFGLAARVPLICLPHHDNHAGLSFAASPFADDGKPVAIAVLDGTGDQGSTSLDAVESGAMRRLYCNDSMFDLLGAFYSVISSTQGGWTWLSSEGRYMGAAAWRHEPRHQSVLCAAARRAALRRGRRSQDQPRDGQLVLRPVRQPLPESAHPHPRSTATPDQLCNSDAVLRVEDIHHRPDTKDRLDKAAATQLLFEDAMIHVGGSSARVTGASRLVLNAAWR